DVPGMDGLHTSLQAEVPQIDVRVKLDVARRYGIKPGDVRRAAGTLVAGEEVGDMFQHGVSPNVMVWSPPNTRDSLTAIRNLPIDTPTHGQVRLATLADVAIRPTPQVIHRERARRAVEM